MDEDMILICCPVNKVKIDLSQNGEYQKLKDAVIESRLQYDKLRRQRDEMEEKVRDDLLAELLGSLPFYPKYALYVNIRKKDLRCLCYSVTEKKYSRKPIFMPDGNPLGKKVSRNTYFTILELLQQNGYTEIK